MENNPTSPSKTEIVEHMFESLNSYTNELQQELEMLNRKLDEQARIEQNYDSSYEQLQGDLIKLRAAIETNMVKRSILDRNLAERTTISQSLHAQIVDKRKEQNTNLEGSNTKKYNHYRAIGKITEQCANLTMAFRTNYHAYARADLDEIRRKTEIRLKTISDEVASCELSLNNDKDKLIEMNKRLDQQIKHFDYFMQTIDIIANKLRVEYEDIIKYDNHEQQLTDIQTTIDELESWHTRTNYPSKN